MKWTLALAAIWVSGCYESSLAPTDVGVDAEMGSIDSGPSLADAGVEPALDSGEPPAIGLAGVITIEHTGTTATGPIIEGAPVELELLVRSQIALPGDFTISVGSSAADWTATLADATGAALGTTHAVRFADGAELTTYRVAVRAGSSATTALRITIAAQAPGVAMASIEIDLALGEDAPEPVPVVVAVLDAFPASALAGAGLSLRAGEDVELILSVLALEGGTYELEYAFEPAGAFSIEPWSTSLELEGAASADARSVLRFEGATETSGALVVTVRDRAGASVRSRFVLTGTP